jgi:phosphoglycolate phosphatase
MATLTIKETIIKTIIFDFDGTLAKLNIDFNQMREAIGKLILSYGINRDDLHTNFVLEMITAATAILNQLSPQKVDNFAYEANIIIENIEIEAANDGELFDQTRELLVCLRSRGLSCGIITRNCVKAVKIVFPDILSYCPVVICRDDVNNVKPHADHLTTALKKLGSSAENTLMIGDHPLDIKTGLNAGTKTCGVLSGHFQKKDFIEAGANLVLLHATDLLYMIK